MPQYSDIARKSDVWEQITKDGIVTFLPMDFEVNSLNQYMAQLIRVGMAQTSLSGKVLDTLELDAKMPEHALMAPQAALVVQYHVEEMQKGEPPHIVIGKMREFMDNAAKALWHAYPEKESVIDYIDEKNHWDVKLRDPESLSLEETEGRKNRKTVRLIPLLDDGGKVVYDLAVDENGKFIYYRGKNNVWRKKPAAKRVIGQNITNADNRWMWSMLYQNCFRDVFVPHMRQFGNYMSDTLALSRSGVLFAPGGEDGLKLGKRTDPISGEEILSGKLEKVMEANTRLASSARSIREGILMPADSVGGGNPAAKYDPEEAHRSPLYDAFASLALYLFMRHIMPDYIKFRENLGDLSRLRDFLMTGEDGQLRPLFSFGRFAWNDGSPALTAHMGVTINLDEQYGDRKKALILALDQLRPDPHDPSALLLHDGRNIFDLDQGELQKLMQREREKSDGLFQVLSLRKNYMLATAKDGLRVGANKGYDLDTLEHMRRNILRDTAFQERAMAAFEAVQPTFLTPEDIAVPLPEEEIFTHVGDPDWRTFKALSVKTGDYEETLLTDIHERAKDRFNAIQQRNAAGRSAIEPDPIEWALEKPLDDQIAALKAFRHKIKKAQDNAQKYASTYGFSIPDTMDFGLGEIVTSLSHKARRNIENGDEGLAREEIAKSLDKACQYLWCLRKDALDNLWFENPVDNYWVIDRDNNNQAIPWDVIVQMDSKDRVEGFQPRKGKNGKEKPPRFEIQFETIPATEQLLALMFFSSGKQDLLSKDWHKWYEARLALIANGPPNEDPDRHRFPTAAQSLKVSRRMRENLTDDDLKAVEEIDERLGLYDIFMKDKKEAMKILKGWEAYYKDFMKKHPWTKEKMKIAGYDPDTGLPIENVPLKVKPEHTIIIDIPDAHLDSAPLSDPGLAYQFKLAAMPKDARRQWKKWQSSAKLKDQANIVFRGTDSGRMFVASKARIKKWPAEKMRFQYAFAQARRDYEEDGYALPTSDNKDLVAISFEYLDPLANTRKINSKRKDILMPHEDDFLGTVNAALAGRNPDTEGTITGLAIRHYTETYAAGDKVRLRQTDSDGQETGWEVETKLTSVRKVSIAKLSDDIESGKFTNQMAVDYGFGHTQDMLSKMRQAFVTQGRDWDSPNNEILLIRFEPVQKDCIAWFKPDEIPWAKVKGKRKKGERLSWAMEVNTLDPA